MAERGRWRLRNSQWRRGLRKGGTPILSVVALICIALSLQLSLALPLGRG